MDIAEYPTYEQPYVLDPSGRYLTWIYIGPEIETVKETCKVEFVPRWNKGIVLRKCDRPDFSGYNGFLWLNDEIHQWLLDTGYRYQLDMRYVELVKGWYVGFSQEKQAAHFKLAWGAV